MTGDAPVLSVENLSVGFHVAGGFVMAVEDVSFTVQRGEILAILGESGSGKSVSAATVMGLIDMPPAVLKGGDVRFCGESVFAMDQSARRRMNGNRIAMIFQDPLAHLNPVYTVGWQIAETFRAHNAEPEGGAWSEAVRLLGRVGIPDPEKRAHQYPHEFSGGQRQRVMIAMALALRPALLIADEPTTALDVTVQAQILDLLSDLRTEFAMSVVMITHDLGVAAAFADRLVVMQRGRVVETGETRQVFEAPRHPYTQSLLAASQPRTVAPEAVAAGTNAPPLLNVRGLTKTYTVPGRGLFGRPHQVEAVRDISFDIRAGETVGLVGESGSGKSTVARMLLRLSEPTAGEAFWNGVDIFAMPKKEHFQHRRKLQMVFQDPYASLNPRMTIGDIVAEPWSIHPDILPAGQRKDRVADLLAMVGLEADHADRYPHQFSGGQRQRIAIARALASEPELIVCDEAVSALDVSIQAQVIDLLRDLQRRIGLAYLFITHDLPLLQGFADRVLVMCEGVIREQGRTTDVLATPSDDYTKRLIAAVPRPRWSS